MFCTLWYTVYISCYPFTLRKGEVMNKTVTLKCNKCGKEHVFEVGTKDMATLQDVVDKVPERDAEKLLEAVNRMLMNKTEAQRTRFMMNNADALSMINYDLCGAALNLFEGEAVKDIYAKYTPQQTELMNKSLAMWDDAQKGEGFLAFDARFYCRKCKKLVQGLYLKVRAIDDKRERVFLYNQKCKTCNSELVLVNDANMGYLFEGMSCRAPCPSCGTVGPVVTDVKFKP